MRGSFLSDLHLFSNRCDWKRYQNQFESVAERGEFVILGGDIFDFKWSRYGTLERTVQEAIDWLARLSSRHAECSFYYLLGNHDSHPSFVAALDRLAFEKPNLQWQPYWLRMGNSVFLHGDVLDGGMEHGGMEHEVVDKRRKKHSCEPVSQAYRHWIYDVAVQVKIHRVIATVARRRSWVLRKLTEYLNDQGVGKSQGITDVYFGHTHRLVMNVNYDGLRFHNGGACIKGLSFRILDVPV